MNPLAKKDIEIQPGFEPGEKSSVIYSSWRKYCAIDKGCEWERQVMLRNWKSFLICAFRTIPHIICATQKLNLNWTQTNQRKPAGMDLNK